MLDFYGWRWPDLSLNIAGILCSIFMENILRSCLQYFQQNHPMFSHKHIYISSDFSTASFSHTHAHTHTYNLNILEIVKPLKHHSGRGKNSSRAVLISHLQDQAYVWKKLREVYGHAHHCLKLGRKKKILNMYINIYFWFMAPF